MSPIFEYQCTFCGGYTERIQKYDKAPPCPECTGFMIRMPSTPGYRRDKTVVKDDD